MSQKPNRLDRVLVARGLAPSRSQAQALIREGRVWVAGRRITRPAYDPGQADIVLEGDTMLPVSRGAHKLAAALDHFSLSPKDRVALDVGAATGGFTQCLLTRGAQRVYAVDVGRDQLHESLRQNPRVICREQTDARELTAQHVPEPVSAITIDVSFISLTLALPVPLGFAVPGAWLVALVKPQFEAGRRAVGKGGIVRKPEDRQAALDKVCAWVSAQAGWQVLGTIPSPILGKSGNQEFLLAAHYQGDLVEKSSPSAPQPNGRIDAKKQHVNKR